MRAGRALAATVGELEAGLSGANGLVDPVSGDVDRDRFAEFANRVAIVTGLATIGYEPLIDDRDRVAYELESGGPIKQAGPTGALIRATTRPTYAPVRWSLPLLDSAAAVKGFDILSNPARAAAAASAVDTGTAGFSAPLPVQPTGATGFFVVQPIYAVGAPVATAAERREALVGYIASAVPGTRLLEAMLSGMPSDTRLEVTDTGTALAATSPAPVGGRSVTFTAGGRQWAITLQRPSARHVVGLLTGLGTLVAAAGVALALSRNRRQTEELRTSARSVQLLGVLSEQLAAAETVDQMADAVGAHGPATVGADRATIALVDDGRPRQLVQHGAHVHVVAEVLRPVVEAWREENPVFVGDSGEMRRRFRETAAIFASRDTEAVAALPLRRPSGEVIGVITCEWGQRQRFRQRTRATLDAVAELCQQSLLRAQAQETRRATAASLSTLGQRLSVARSFTEVANEVVNLAPGASGAPIVAIGLCNEAFTTLQLMRSPLTAVDPTVADDGAGVFVEIPVDPNGALVARLREGERMQFHDHASIDVYPALRELVGPRVDRLSMFPLVESDGVIGGVLVFVYADSPRFGVWNEPGRMMTIADLTAQTLERARLYQRQHELVLELQRRTLPDLPSIPGLTIAARYLPSSSALGLGGDWYDVQPIGDGIVGLVVGDVVGHGIEAIADMTEMRTTVSTLLRTDTDLSRVATMASDLLTADSADVVFATAVLMIIDCPARELRYVRAGHPPPMVRAASGAVTVLEDAGTTPIGLGGPVPRAGTTAFASGSVLIAYTDGLVERRRENIDVGLARLRDALAASSVASDVEQLADELVEACLGGRTTDDDAALVVVRIH